MRLYDGTDTCSHSDYPSSVGPIDTSLPIIIGNFDEKIKEFRLWNTILYLDSQIDPYSHYYLNIEGLNELVVYYPMNEGKGNSFKDRIKGRTASTTPASSLSLEYLWTKDYNLPICRSAHAFDLNLLTCQPILPKTFSTLDKIEFKLKTRPKHEMPFSFWFKSRSSYGNIIDIGGVMQFTSVSSDKYSSTIETTKYPSLSVQIIVDSTITPPLNWVYVGCSWISLPSILRINPGNISKFEQPLSN